MLDRIHEFSPSWVYALTFRDISIDALAASLQIVKILHETQHSEYSFGFLV